MIRMRQALDGPAVDAVVAAAHQHAVAANVINLEVRRTLVLARGLLIDKVYVGYWFRGRPSS